MTQAGKVAEIFSTAGEAFTKLGQLAMSLQPSVERSQQDGKWGDEEIDMLKKAVQQFGTDVEKISEKIRTKSAVQVKSMLKNKAIQNFNEISQAKNSTNPAILSQLHSSPVKIQQTTSQRIIGQKSKPTTSVVVSNQPLKKTKIDIPVNMNILTSIPQIKTMTMRQNNTGLPIVASNQGFQVLLPQQQLKTSSAVVPPIMRTSISGVSVIGTSSIVVPVTNVASITSSIPVVQQILPSALSPTLSIAPSTVSITLSSQQIVGVSSIITSNTVQKIDNINTSANVDVES